MYVGYTVHTTYNTYARTYAVGAKLRSTWLYMGFIFGGLGFVRAYLGIDKSLAFVSFETIDDVAGGLENRADCT